MIYGHMQDLLRKRVYDAHRNEPFLLKAWRLELDIPIDSSIYTSFVFERMLVLNAQSIKNEQN